MYSLFLILIPLLIKLGAGRECEGAPQEGGEAADCVVGLPLPLKVPRSHIFASEMRSLLRKHALPFLISLPLCSVTFRLLITC